MQTIKAKKSLGQNFLIDQEALTDIAGSIELSGRHIIEVGPGYGALTEHIVASQPLTLDLVELDTDMISILDERKQEEWKHIPLTIHHQDVLTFIPIYDEYSVIANIPYYITSPILFHFLYPPANGGKQQNGGSGVETVGAKKKNSDNGAEGEGVSAPLRSNGSTLGVFVDPSGAFGTFQSGKVHSFNPPREMTIMMQKEVGEKILEGRARKPHHSFLSLAMELACEDIEIVRYVGKESFDPAPKIDSIVLKFTVKQTRNPETEKQLINLWKIAFTHPRKTLLSNLKGSHYNIEDIRKTLIELGYDEKVRAEAVKMEDWLEILLTK